ncbi:protein kinase C-binding protein NELL1 [Biomphalaria glabrata]|nr:protein kinase C-binding protein NELL1 [Biomphalaria glabrata]
MCCEWSFTKSTHNRSTLCSARLLLALRVGLVFMLLLGSNIGLAVEPAGHEVLDLLQGLNATSAESLAGLRYTNGPNTSSPAILLEGKSIHLGPCVLCHVVRLLASFLVHLGTEFQVSLNRLNRRQ